MPNLVTGGQMGGQNRPNSRKEEEPTELNSEDEELLCSAHNPTVGGHPFWLGRCKNWTDLAAAQGE